MTRPIANESTKSPSECLRSRPACRRRLTRTKAPATHVALIVSSWTCCTSAAALGQDPSAIRLFGPNAPSAILTS